MVQPTPILSNPAAFLKRVRDIATDSFNVIIPPLEECRSGSVLMSQVWQALERGELEFGPVVEEDGAISGVLWVRTSGLPVYVTVNITPEGNQLIVRRVEEG